MSGGTVLGSSATSADPEEMEVFLDLGGRVADGVELLLGEVMGLAQSVSQACGVRSVDTDVLHAVSAFGEQARLRQAFVESVQTAVMLADTTAAPGVVSLPDAAIEYRLVTGGLGQFVADGLEGRVGLIEELAAGWSMTYEQAEYVLVEQGMAEMSAQIDGLPAGSALRDQLLEERRALVEVITGGDDAFTVATVVGLDDGLGLSDAVLGAAGEAFASHSVGGLMEVIGRRGAAQPGFDLGLVALQEQLAVRAEQVVGVDVARLNLAVVAYAEQQRVSYNEAAVLFNQMILADPGRPGEEPDLVDLLDEIPVADTVEAALILQAERSVFDELDGAFRSGELDGRIADSDLAAVLDSGSGFSPQAKRIAAFLSANPEEWAKLDTARTTQFMEGLATGDDRFRAEGGDNIVSFADVSQFTINGQLFNALNQARLEGDLLDLDVDGTFDEDEFQAALDRIGEHDEFLGSVLSTVINDGLYKQADLRSGFEKLTGTVVDLGQLAGHKPADVSGKVELFKGIGDWTIGLGQLGWDAAAASNSTPVYWLEMQRVGGDVSEHRGLILASSVPTMISAVYNGGMSLVPGTSQWTDSMEEVRHWGTWDRHQGYALTKELIDWETLIENPERWVGRMLPDLLLSLAGGGGVITKAGTTAQRLTTSLRRLLQQAAQNGTTLTTELRKLALITARTKATALADHLRQLNRTLRPAIASNDLEAMSQLRRDLISEVLAHHPHRVVDPSLPDPPVGMPASVVHPVLLREADAWLINSVDSRRIRNERDVIARRWHLGLSKNPTQPDRLVTWNTTHTRVAPHSLGEALPDPSAPGSNPAAVSRENVVQGAAGDCYFVAAVAALTDRPWGRQLIDSMITTRGNQYVVRFADGSEELVDPTFYLDWRGENAYGGGPNNKANWFSVLEKAYAQRHANSYRQVEGGWSAHAWIELIDGKYGSVHQLQPQTDELRPVLESLLTDSHSVTVVIDLHDIAPDMFPEHSLHSFSVHGRSNADGLALRNPWGSNGALKELLPPVYDGVFSLDWERVTELVQVVEYFEIH